ncbi:hypothetical protein Z517_09595 [Fonsecaea pedrosoi CBS 271.37]|uniref:aldehyde dehydrogenase (NAD(+)) n=1 Tax=Fonsecaea pedrosoi CBS 271.37 TaxID=1442368 RepID=A0A0D2GXQ1_9EURO|nr:uncharacterized protein Z517_09595 [Fonsecaea pedrosoi CBS 271.37]KIW77149.1 hypothetical protein Z517_09595 [Fonsecaea pedrosoi CBS 271.37]
MGDQKYIKNGDSGRNAIETRLFIDNEFVLPKAGKAFQLVDPATNQATVWVSEADKDDVDRAVAAAQRALGPWSSRAGLDRATFLLKLADLLERDNHILARLEAMSMGRPVSSYAEGFGAARYCRYVAGLVPNVRGESSLVTEGFINITLRQPYGVCAAITPWNAPITMLTFKVAPCVGAGNTLVVKTSEKAPLTSLHFAKLVREAGFPAGVVNILSGFGEPCGAALAAHMDVRKISFTGSVAAGRAVKLAATRSNLKEVTLELGGKSPMVVFDDANVVRAAEAAARTTTFNSGQACTSCQRVYVHRAVVQQFRDLVVDKTRQLGTNATPGSHPLDTTTKHGPHPDQKQFDHIMKYISAAQSSQCEILLGGKREGTRGFFIEPTIIFEPDEHSPMMREEIFGSVLCISTFTDEDDVFRRANDSEYGLYASVFTRDLARALRAAKRFEAGNVGLNVASPFQTQDMPFNGWKQSGSGKELGKTCVEDWTETKTCYMSLET